MRKFAILFLFTGAMLHAQISNPSVRYVSVAPSGSCAASPPIQIVISTGVVYTCNNGTWGAIGGSGSGTVTSVGWTGGIVSVANPTTTPAFTIAGTSGGIPYFSSASAWASSAALTNHGLLVGGGAGAAPAALAVGGANFPLIGQSSANPAFSTIAYPGSATSGGIPYFSSTTAITSSAALTHYGVVYGGGAGGAPVSTAADTTTTHALFATATAPAFRALAGTDFLQSTWLHLAMAESPETSRSQISTAGPAHHLLPTGEATELGRLQVVPAPSTPARQGRSDTTRRMGRRFPERMPYGFLSQVAR